MGVCVATPGSRFSRHPDAAHDFGCTNLWIYNDADHDAAVARFAADPTQPFPVLFISFPSAKDPTFHQRYPGRSTIEVVAPAPYGWFAQWADTRWKKRGADYDQLKQGLARRLRNELEQHVPSVRGCIDYAELSTPLSTRHFANYHEGEIYGLSAVPARFRWRGLGARSHHRKACCRSGLRGRGRGDVGWLRRPKSHAGDDATGAWDRTSESIREARQLARMCDAPSTG